MKSRFSLPSTAFSGALEGGGGTRGVGAVAFISGYRARGQGRRRERQRHRGVRAVVRAQKEHPWLRATRAQPLLEPRAGRMLPLLANFTTHRADEDKGEVHERDGQGMAISVAGTDQVSIVMCMNMCRHMYRQVYRHAYRHVYTYDGLCCMHRPGARAYTLHDHVYTLVYTHVYTHTCPLRTRACSHVCKTSVEVSIRVFTHVCIHACTHM